MFDLLGNRAPAPYLNRPAKPRFRGAAPGFALVATLLMMMLMVILALGMFSLSTISLRREGVEAPIQQARANARVALAIAISKLQETLGPDQRISADGRVANKGSAVPANPNWLSVWKTTKPDGSPWIIRNGERGGLSDDRQRGYDAGQERIATLVSGNESKMIYTDDQPVDPATSAKLVGEGSLGKNANSKDHVRAPLVSLSEAGKQKGSYAWWAGDLGTRANVRTRDRSEDNSPEGDLHAVMLAQDASWKAFGTKDIPNAARGALVDEPQLALFDRNLEGGHFHDYTVWSAGLPIDVREGGWRKDLTAYLESNGTLPEYRSNGVVLPGVTDSDNLVGPANTAADQRSAFPGQAQRLSGVSPNFGLLRKWAARANSAKFGALQLSSELGDMATASTGGGNSEKSIDFRNRTTTHLMPVLVEGSLYYNLSYYDLGTPASPNPYGMRVHLYPRVVLWNPYNFTLNVPASAIFMHINGAKWVEVTMDGGRKRAYRMFWGISGGSETGGSARGSMYFKMDAATLEPGESLVWSPAKNAVYSEANFGANTLTTSVAPSPTRGFYMDRREDKLPLFDPKANEPDEKGLFPNVLAARPVEWREVVPAKLTGNVQKEAYTQADDYFMSWKPLNGNFNNTVFAKAPMGRFVSCAYQFGDEDELPVEWTSFDPVPYPMTSPANAVITQIPDRRTRDGFRLRWFQETQSNLIGSGSLSGTPHLEDSAIGNWNMRASWSYRSPFDNVSDLAPNFFGIYTRDLFDGEVDWSNLNPRAAGSKFRGDPFDQPIRSTGPRILFDIPRRGAEIASLGALQHANFSEFIWHPTYALGNSLADPRVPVDHTEPDRSMAVNKDKGGWNQNSIGYATDGRSDNNGEAGRTHEDNWAYHARSFLQHAALDQTLVYDLSYELNHTLWDSYFLSSGTAEQKRDFLSRPEGSPLPNGRMTVNTMAGKVTPDDLTDYHRAASRLLIDGAFNVNSTSVAAWEALLLSAVDKDYGDKIAFPRFLGAPGGEWSGSDPRGIGAWAGQRVFSRTEIHKLATQIVEEVERRGPFLSLADFVNRRLTEGDTGTKGTLQAAIDRAGLNDSFQREWPLNNSVSLPEFKSADNIFDSTRMEQTLKPDTTAWGALGFLTQADLLQFIGPALSARSDTFKIRAYGESIDATGKVVAKAWCEAVVQRSPNYVDRSDDLMEMPDTLSETNQRFGRRFEVVFFRWMSPEEV